MRLKLALYTISSEETGDRRQEGKARPVLGKARTEALLLCASCWDTVCLNHQYSVKNLGKKKGNDYFSVGSWILSLLISLGPFQVEYISLKMGLSHLGVTPWDMSQGITSKQVTTKCKPRVCTEQYLCKAIPSKMPVFQEQNLKWLLFFFWRDRKIGLILFCSIFHSWRLPSLWGTRSSVLSRQLA